MNKKAQVTMFIIIGIVIVVLVALLIYFKDIIFFAPTSAEDLSSECDEIQDHISDCISEVSEEPVRRLGIQGGYLSTPEDTFRLWNGSYVSYLCFNMRDTERCRNRMLQEKDIEEQLESAIQQQLATCLNVKSFGSGRSPYSVEQLEPYKTSAIINQDDITIILNYPLKLSSKRSALEVNCQEDYLTKLDYPLGRLLKVVLDIIDSETEFGEFEQLTYMLAQKGQYIIYKHRPYPDKVYQIKTKDNPYIFQFAIEGEPS